MKRALAAGAPLVVGAALCACHVHGSPKNAKPREAGVSIAVYERDDVGYSVIDDRRWIELGTQTSILLANIDPGADLASLVLEPASSALHVGSCTRDRLPNAPDHMYGDSYREREQLRDAVERERQLRAVRGEAPPPPTRTPRPAEQGTEIRYAPVVRCEVSGAPGTYLLRVLYVSRTLRYHAQHDVEVSADGTTATVVSRFALPTPLWRTRADVVLFDGVPGGEHPPKEVTRGTIDLDGSVAILAVPAKQVSAGVRRVFDGAILGDDAKDPQWGRDSANTVWVWLELAALQLAPGPLHVHLQDASGPQDVDIPSTSRKQDDAPNAPLRLPLWTDDELRAVRVRTPEYDDGSELTERFVFTIANTGTTSREVFVEEHLRPAQHRKIEHAWPKKATVAAPGEILRTKIDAKPGLVTRAGYTLTYDY